MPGGETTLYATVFGSWNTVIPVGKEIIRIDLIQNSSHPQGWGVEITVVVENLATPLPLKFHPNGDLYFGYFTVINGSGYEGVGIAKFTGSDGDPVGSQTGLFRSSNNDNEVGLYQGPNAIEIDNSTNLVFLVRGKDLANIVNPLNRRINFTNLIIDLNKLSFFIITFTQDKFK